MYALVLEANYVWISEGSGTSSVVTVMANNPELGAAPNAQTLKLSQFTLVAPATFDVPTAAELAAAVTNSAAGIQAQITTAVLNSIQGWKTGQP